MKREYAFAYNINGTKLSGIITMTNPPTLVCYCDKENSKLILDALNTPLPPAEGARKVQWSGYGELGNISQKPLQPTAEGAEEILRKNCNTCYSRSTGEEEVWSSVSSVLIAMQDFATLHAQRIAEKMGEEKLREELNLFENWRRNQGFFANATATFKIVDEYLKSIER